MPGRLKVRILSGRDLPIMDRASELTDAFVETTNIDELISLSARVVVNRLVERKIVLHFHKIYVWQVRFGNDTYKTEVCKKSLNPQWNSEWFKFEAEDEELQDEPLDLRVLDYDTYSAHDAIGKVYIDLNPLLTREAPNIISGWFPIYDTMHGIRGELNVQVRVEFFSDFNKFRQSSCGIQFFCSWGVPCGWRIQEMFGFVEELVVNDDPEYQWIDKIRTPRASNEARQRLFSKLSGLRIRLLEPSSSNLKPIAKSSAERAREYRQRIKDDPVKAELYRLKYLERNRANRKKTITPEEQQRRQELNRARQQKYRDNQKALRSTKEDASVSVGTVTTRRQQQELSTAVEVQRAKWRKYKQAEREKWSCQKKRRNRERARAWYQNNRAKCSELTGELQRKLGVKVLEMGGNAVLGYHQNFDLEGESGIVVRAIGTAVSLTRSTVSQSSPVPLGHVSPAVLSSTKDSTPQEESHNISPSLETTHEGGTDAPNLPSVFSSSSVTPTSSHSQGQQTQNRHSASPVRIVTSSSQNRRLSDSEVGSSHTGSGSVPTPGINPQTHSGHSKACGLLQSIDMVEYPFFTMRNFPPGFIINLGGVVSARSVKLLDKIHNPEEPETRDAWWSEVRTEIRAHATKLGCHAVLAYQEHTAICDEVIILSAMGTAAKINLNFNAASQCQPGLPSGMGQPHTPLSAPNTDKAPLFSGSKGVGGTNTAVISGDKMKEKAGHLFVDISLANQALDWKDETSSRCSICHIPYSLTSLPFEIQLSKCALCRKKLVPEVLFTTIDPPDNIPICSRGNLIQARLCRAKSKNKNSEQSAREVSDSLPFLEYEIHNQLINKMKIRGLNCLFGLKIQISLGENILAAVATATGTYLGPLPAPPVPVLSTQVATAEESQDVMNLQKKFAATAQMHRDFLNSEIGDILTDLSPPPPDSDDESDNGEDDADVVVEKSKDRNTFVLVVDDLKDESMSMILEDATAPEGFNICNTQSPPGIPSDRLTGNLQMFAQILHVRFNPTMNTGLEFSNIFNTVLKRICFKMRSFKPCCLVDVSFNIDLADEDEVTVVVTGCCLTLEEPSGQIAASTNVPFKFLNQAAETNKKALPCQTDEMMFPLDGVGDQASATHGPLESVPNPTAELNIHLNEANKSTRALSNKVITLTPVSSIPDCHITSYLGYYNFFFIRESTSVRENGGIGGFMQSFLVQVLAIVRAHVKALGGNALVAFNLWQCVLDNNPHKNQGQCLINVSGDMVMVSHGTDKVEPGDTSSLIIPSTS